MMKSRENAQKPVFPAYFRYLQPEENLFGKSGSVPLFEHCHFPPLCQKSEKTNEPIPRKAGTKKMVKGNFPKKRKSGINDEKKFSGRNFFGHIAITHFWTKNQYKLVMKSRENTKKPVFPAYFRHFRPENRHISGIFGRKIYFSKIGLRHILGIAILHECAKFHEKNVKYSSRNSRNTVFPAKIGCSGDF